MSTKIKDIAAKAGVSISTVSKILNNNSNCSKRTKEKVFNIANEMNYSPNIVARSLVTGKSNIIAFIGANALSDSLFGNILKETMEYLQTKNYRLVHCDIDTLNKITFDGAIILEDYQEIKKLSSIKKPIVAIESRWKPKKLYCDTIYVNMNHAIKEVLNNFLKLKCKNIAFAHVYDFNEMFLINDPRAVLYKSFIEENNMPFKSIDFSANYRGAIFNEFIEYAKYNDIPEAIFCANDETALGISMALNKLGKKIPEDVLISGCDAMPDTNCYFPNITTIDLFFNKTFKMAIDILLEKISNDNQKNEDYLLKELIAKTLVRESTQK